VTDSPPPKLNLEQLLRLGVRAARTGNQGAARSLFRSLAREYPNDVRAWLGLAGVAESQAEQRDALARVIAIDPHHPQARQALERLSPPPAAIAPPSRTDQALPEAPAATEDAPTPGAAAPALAEPPGAAPRDRPRFALLNRLALAIIGLLLIALLVQTIRIFGGGATAERTPVPPSPVLQVAGTARPIASAVSPPQPRPGAATATPSAPPPATGPLVQSTPAVGMPAPPTLPLGTVLEADGWSATLLRPDYALLLDGSIGDLQPSGRFVLALVAVSNNAAQPRRIPSGLFMLVDSRGRRYSPSPNASSAYLTLYGRGQRGDLAFEDSLDPGSGMRGIPLIFDVPDDAAGLVLTVSGAGSTGWPIDSVSAPPTNTGP
jgi:hypothetical protein